MEQEIEYNVVDHIIKMDGDLLITDDIVFIREFLRFNDWILAKKRDRELVYMRRYICYIISDKLKGGKDLSLKKIGNIMGGINHATVIHHIKSHRDQIYTNDYLYKSIMKETDSLISKFKRFYHRIK